MAETYKILGQVAPSNTQERVLYTSPAATQTLVNNLTVANRSASSQTFDINIYDTAQAMVDIVLPTPAIVAVGPSTGDALYSTDGITWVRKTLPASISWYSVVFGNNTFLAVAQGSTTAATSTDGITWTLRTMQYPPEGANWGWTAHGNNTFFSISSYSATATASTDGITWVTRTLPSAQNWIYTTYANNIFIVLASGSTRVVTSTDSITWVIRTMPSAASWNKVAYGNGIYLATAAYGSAAAATSTDSITWTLRTIPVSGSWRALAYGNGKFVTGTNGNTTTAYSTTNGITWTLTTMPMNYTRSIIYAAGKFYAIASYGAKSATSTDGISWTSSDNGGSYIPWNQLSYGASSFPVSPAINNLYKNVTIGANQSQVLQPGITLGAQNSIVVSGNTDLTYSAYGVELS